MKRKREEFGKIFTEYLDNLYNGALKLTNNSVDAEDLVGETFLRGFRFYSRFKPGTNIKAWLFKIMHNLFINEFRKRKKEPKALELKEEILYPDNRGILPTKLLALSEDFFSRFLDGEVQGALDALPEEFKKTVILSDLEGFNYQEISEILGCPIGTVRSRLARGREILFNELYDYAQSHGYIRG